MSSCVVADAPDEKPSGGAGSTRSNFASRVLTPCGTVTCTVYISSRARRQLNLFPLAKNCNPVTSLIRSRFFVVQFRRFWQSWQFWQFRNLLLLLRVLCSYFFFFLPGESVSACAPVTLASTWSKASLAVISFLRPLFCRNLCSLLQVRQRVLSTSSPIIETTEWSVVRLQREQ